MKKITNIILKARILLAAILLAGVSQASFATTITFSEQVLTAGNGAEYLLSSDGFYRVDFVAQPGVTGHNHIITVDGNEFESGHGQSYQGLRITSVSNDSFNLGGFDMRGGWRVGTELSSAGTTYKDGNYTGVGPWTNVDLSLTGSEFFIYALASGGTGRGDLDNIVLTAVPVPAAALLFGSALLGLGAVKKRRKV